jgi:NAD(P)-dependent dehydrogenase (short-subunit alcohol dehydrogenase family)
MPITYDFTDRFAVVTGGAQGFGRTVAERLLAGGGAVAIWDSDADLVRETTAALAAAGKVIGLVVDVADYAAVEHAHAETDRAFGRIDILVNNAGIAGLNAKVWEYPIEEWSRVLAINLTGQFNCLRAIIPGMIERNFGRVANVASIAGKEGNPNASAYSASKAGVIALTKSIAKEVADRNISVNAITPAAARTRIFDQITEEHIQYMLSKIPRGRFVTVDEVADMIAFMVSDACSFTTGAVFDISGGRATY